MTFKESGLFSRLQRSFKSSDFTFASEIDHIVENEINVVLVDCMVYNEEKKEYEHVYRWFEVTADFEKEYDEELLGELIVYDEIYKQPNRKKCALFC